MKKETIIHDSIILFSFRRSQKKFFEQLIVVCRKSKKIEIISSKSSWKISLKSFQSLRNIDQTKACEFAINEFYAKNSFFMPRFLLQGYFKVFAILNILRYYTVLDKGYSKMLIWNGGKFRQLLALDIAKHLGIKVYFFENGLLPNTIVFDHKGINYNNSVPRKKSFYEKNQIKAHLPSELVPRVGKNRDIFKGKKEPLPEIYIFVPFQVDADTQIISQSPWIRNMRALYDIIENIAKNSKYHFVLKEHPSSGVEYPDLHQRASLSTHISFQNTYPTQQLIEKSTAVVTINSTVGIESLLFHKKVIVLGNAFYDIEGITYGVKSEEQLHIKLEEIESLSLDIVLVDNFLHYLYTEYLIAKNDDMYLQFCKKLYVDRSVHEVVQ